MEDDRAAAAVIPETGPLPCRLGAPAGARAALGLVVLQTDETIEAEFRRLLPEPDVALHVSRVPMAAGVDLASLAAMQGALAASAGLLPARRFAAVGYGCTSGATVIGPERVAALLHEGARTAATATPIEAVISACHRHGIARLALVTPYLPEVSARIVERLEAAGIAVVRLASFEQGDDPTVARIAPASIRDALVATGAGAVDGVFVSCTNLQTLGVIAEAEAALGKPVIASNAALAWALRGHAGLGPLTGLGRLMAGPAFRPDAARPARFRDDA
ncbi:aspartate/glutamate racemase family protein [Paralimibaculum aggregatum]|uniref:Aspartate/glutamate racemase family protein n=1 Tax=Paralimibaculum aggregatum TaxID=3036245 RepID=A0ABQ6LQN9_9RHOB|nr:Asp/Glu racemase [Limibaculum sp. NKW23]GMG83091.1 aspartate/glutamate racemase family protein [Limibaculum sp. NKW23]